MYIHSNIIQKFGVCLCVYGSGKLYDMRTKWHKTWKPNVYVFAFFCLVYFPVADTHALSELWCKTCCLKTWCFYQ